MMLRKKRRIGWLVLFAGFSLLVLYFLFLDTHKASSYKTTVITLGGSVYTVALADTPTKRAHGLSDTTQIPYDGMLFVFDTLDTYSFWMKDMQYPVDFIWLGEDKTVVDMHEHISPDTYPKQITPIQPVLYVLEVPSGFIQSHGIKKGDSISF